MQTNTNSIDTLFEQAQFQIDSFDPLNYQIGNDIINTLQKLTDLIYPEEADLGIDNERLMALSDMMQLNPKNQELVNGLDDYLLELITGSYPQ